MRTRKPISTIHYVDEQTLAIKLDELINNNVIDFYLFIKHLKEDEDKKNHIHLFIVPNGQINTDTLRKELEFIDKANIKPITPLPFVNSKFKDFYLYALHDKDYLNTKGLVKKYHYQKEDFITSDIDYLNELYCQENFSKDKIQNIVIDMANAGFEWEDIVTSHMIPTNQIFALKEVYNAVTRQAKKRVYEKKARELSFKMELEHEENKKHLQ